MRNKISFFLFFFFPLFLFSQKESNIWYFGNAGLNFNSGTPLPLTNSSIAAAFEGTASISDKNGNLLFYTDGITIWNKSHLVMTNGSGLLGGNTISTTQQALIVPDPGNGNMYYVFTLDQDANANGFRYSKVDLTLSGGLGAVTTTKNVLLLTPATEKISSIKHCNGKDYWVVVHQLDNNKFNAYLITSSGINTTPVISSVGTPHNGWSEAAGQMKISSQGHKLGLSIMQHGIIEIFDFDRSSGVISNPITINESTLYPYGFEFSPDESKAYYGTVIENKVYQIDLCAGNPSAVISSKTMIGTVSAKGNQNGAFQLGPDCKIYMALGGYTKSNFLGVINSPDQKGLACNLVDNGQSLGSKQCNFGLPAFTADIVGQSTHCSPTVINVTDSCLGSTTYFSYTEAENNSCFKDPTIAIFWDFGDGSNSGSTNASHLYATPGKYKVKLILTKNCKSDSVEKEFEILPCGAITVSLTGGGICKDDCFNLFALVPAGQNPKDYTWNPNIGSGPGPHKVCPTITTVYTITVSDSLGNKFSDTAIIKVNEPPIVTVLPSNVVLCPGDSVALSASGANTYIWSPVTGLNTNVGSSVIAKPSSATTYQVIGTDALGCKDTTKMIITISSSIVAEAGVSKQLCKGDSVQLNASGGSNYSWVPITSISNPFIPNPFVNPTITTTYSVVVSSGSCVPDTDSVVVLVQDAQILKAWNDTTICEGQTAQLHASGTNNFEWTPASTLSDSTIANPIANPVTTTVYIVTSKQNTCPPVPDSVKVTVLPSPLADAGNSQTITSGQSISLNGTGAGLYNWTPVSKVDDPNSANPTVSPIITTTYTLMLTDSNGCIATDTVTVFVIDGCTDEQNIFLPTAFSPNGDRINDRYELRIKNYDCIKSFRFTIFDRWGENVFETTDPKVYWDGSFRSEELNSNVFDYYLELSLISGENIVKKGNVTLVR